MNRNALVQSPLLRVLWQLRREVLATAALSFAANLLTLTPTLYMLQIYDRVMVSRSELTLLAASAVALFFIAMVAVAEWLRSQLLVRAGVRFDEAVSTRIFHALFERALAQPSNAPADGLQHLLQLRQFLTGPGLLAFLDLPWTPLYVLVAWLLHPLLGGLSLLFVAIFLAMAWWGQRTQSPLAAHAQQQAQALTGHVQARLQHADVVASMGMLSGLRQRWLQLHRHQQRAADTLQQQVHRQQAMQRFVQYSQQSLALATGAWLVIHGELGVGGMIAANVLMSRALQPVQLVASTWKSFFSARHALGELDALLAAHPGRSGVSLPQAPRGRIELSNVSASVPGRQQPILQDIQLVCAPGELTVVLGASGSGKSTLARCLLGLWPGMQGQALLDDVPLAAWDRQALGSHLGYLPQDVQLLAGTVAENIARLGTVDPEQVVQAAQAAGIHELVLRLPQGYETPLDASASQLSAGHRQRIGLARALYGQPALLVLDEPNANLDEAGEAALLKAMDAQRRSGKAVVVITHRGRLIEAADRLVLVEHGRVGLQGPRDQVLRQLAARRRQPLPSTAAPTVPSTSPSPAKEAS